MTFQYSNLLPCEKFEIRQFILENNEKLLPNEGMSCSQEINEQVNACLGKNEKSTFFRMKTMKDIEDDIERINRQPSSQAFRLEQNRKRKLLPKDSDETPEHLRKLLSLKNLEEYSHSRPTRMSGQDCQNTHDQGLALLSVRIFKPICKNQFGKNINTRHLVMDKEFVVLSCQHLNILRDSYCCIGDLIHHEDYSDRIDELIGPFEGHQEFGAFLIDDVFYVDERFRYSGSSIKNVDPIIEWANKKNLAQFSQKDMNKVCFDDLRIQLGFPYVYFHTPHCEHILVFSRIEFSPPFSRQQNLSFPLLIDWNINTIVDCDFCTIRPAKWLIYDCPRLPYTPFHVCKQCNLSFNYDLNKKKIGNFVSMPIIYDCDYVMLEDELIRN